MKVLIVYAHPNSKWDVAAHQRKIAGADGLVFISPIYWLGFPAILKGWFERVFTYGFAYALTAEGWQGYVKGSIPMMHQQKLWSSVPRYFAKKGTGLCWNG